MAKLRVGIIGAGTIGNVHVERYAKNPDVELVGVADILPEKAHLMGSKHDMPHFESSNDLYAAGPVDAVSICVPNNQHKPETLKALSNKCHVLCEKPMALNAKEARTMRNAARKRKRTLMMAMVSRFRHGAVAIKDMIDQGYFGRIYHANIMFLRRRGIPGMGGWFTTKARSGGGPLIDCGVHLLDLTLHLAGFPKLEAVSAATYAEFGRDMKNYNYVSMWAGPPDYSGTFDVEDFASAFYRLSGGFTISLECAWAANMEIDEPMSIMLFGDKGGCRYPVGGEPVFFGENGGYIADLAPKMAQADHFQAEVDHFVDCVTNKRKPLCTAEEGVTMMQLLDATYKSAAQGREVKVKS